MFRKTEIVEKNKTKKEQCPNCKNEIYITFNWEDYSNKFISTLTNFKKCKYGMLFSCKKCGTFWFLGTESSQMLSIPKKDIELIIEWDKRTLLPNDLMLKKLSSIGATPPDIYGNGKDSIGIPCKVITKDKEEIDFCIVAFMSNPPSYPLLNSGNRIIFLDDVVDILESEYALDKKIRFATALAHEVHMGYSPTFVSTPDGQMYVFNGIVE